ncbi:MAG: hypothetical protein ACW99X_18000 [Candidatus Thorarchaeota archaeon]|jgi:predicted  nucleic acid-binding Zn-ribbon protein
MSKDVNRREYIEEQVGSEFLADFLEKTEGMEEALQEADVPQKDLEEQVETVEEEEKTVSPGDQLQILVKAISDELGMDDLNSWVEEAQEALALIPELKAEIAELKKEDDQKIAEQIAPPQSFPWAWTQRESESKDNVLDENDPDDSEMLKDMDADENWLMQAAMGETVIQ